MIIPALEKGSSAAVQGLDGTEVDWKQRQGRMLAVVNRHPELNE